CGLRENVANVVRLFGYSRVQVAVGDSYDKRKMPRPQKFERGDQFARTVLIDKVGKYNDERTFLQVCGDLLKRARIRRFDQFGFQVIKGFEHGIDMSGSAFRWNERADAPAENGNSAIVARTRTGRNKRERNVNSGVEFGFAADPSGHQTAAVEG